jgi:uncharacterized protein YecT (DUF1311 family)
MVTQALRGEGGVVALASAYERHADFVHKALALDAAIAVEYCNAQRAWLEAHSTDIEEEAFVASSRSSSRASP